LILNFSPLKPYPPTHTHAFTTIYLPLLFPQATTDLPTLHASPHPPHTHAPHYQAQNPHKNSTVQEEEDEEEEEEEEKKSMDSHINVSKTTATFSMPSRNSTPGACSAHRTTQN
jgi:hypothetical protein